MRGEKSTWNHLMWFTFLGFLRPAIGIFLLPLYLARITPAEYGILSLVLIFSSLVSSVSGLKLDVAANTFYYDFYEDRKSLINYLGQIFTINFLVGVLFLLVLYFSGAFIFESIFISKEITFYPYGLLAVSNALLISGISIYYSYLRNELRVKEFVWVNVFSILTSVSLQAVLILHYDMGILGILWGSLISAILVFLYIIISNSWLIQFKLNYKLLRPSLIFGLGFLPISFLVIFEKQIDRIFIERFLDLERVGIYALLIGVTGFFAIFLGAFQNAIRPNIYESLKQDGSSKVSYVNDAFKQYCSVGIFALAGVFFVGNHFHLITDNPKYLVIIDYFPYAVAATIPLIFLRFQVLIILFYKKTMLLSIATIIKTLCMICVMFLLIPKYGIMGAISALFTSYMIYFVFLFFVERRLSESVVKYFSPIIRILPFLFLLATHVLFVSPEFRSISSIIILILTTISVFLFEKEAIASIYSSFRNKIS